MKIGIVGCGVVGSSMLALFEKVHDVHCYDLYQTNFNSPKHKEQINTCELVFIAVSTPTKQDGYACDTSAVEKSVEWITAPMCIRSTVPPGTTAKLANKFRSKRIAFAPEHLRETKWDAFQNQFIIVGGERRVCRLVVLAFQAVLGANTKYMQTTSTLAELSKYMLNNFLSLKVAFCNQYYDIAQNYGVDYNELRELWLLDERIGRTHTAITEERAFGGKCFPKDIRAMIAEQPGATLLKAAYDYNKTLDKEGNDKGTAADHRI
jgi:UDPglucose 6-dehydrogenase